MSATVKIDIRQLPHGGTDLAVQMRDELLRTGESCREVGQSLPHLWAVGGIIGGTKNAIKVFADLLKWNRTHLV